GNYSFYRDMTWFKVLNISDETAPALVAQVNLGVNLGEAQVRGHQVYVPWNFGEYTNGTSGIVCVDISDPLAPRELGRWSTPSFHYFGGLYVLGDLAFVPTGG